MTGLKRPGHWTQILYSQTYAQSNRRVPYELVDPRPDWCGCRELLDSRHSCSGPKRKQVSKLCLCIYLRHYRLSVLTQSASCRRWGRPPLSISCLCFWLSSHQVSLSLASSLSPQETYSGKCCMPCFQ